MRWARRRAGFSCRCATTRKIYGRRDPKSGRRAGAAARILRPDARADDANGSKVGPGGRIETFTIVYEEFKTLPDPPYAFGYVLLDGADTALGGFFRGVDLTDPAKAAQKLEVGTRVMTGSPNERKRQRARLLVRARMKSASTVRCRSTQRHARTL